MFSCDHTHHTALKFHDGHNDQQEDNSTDFNSIYIDLTQYLKFFDHFCYCRFLKFHEPFIYTSLSLLVKKLHTVQYHQ